ncbi:RNA polymerase sigma factor [Olivibacter sitiensis]|uniref:RNA polymerase sigma factor n=1 Tax=Olivibacter sitiensis TaxID=376470 RepID=UPI0003FFB03E|nr:sigma-70 family RNA polymerase sigma factor [Olivibacter sitiensis]
MAFNSLPNQAELLSRIATGDERAFAALFRAYFNQVGEFVQLLTNSTETTQEIVQEVFAKIWVNRESLTHVKRFNAYLFIITRNHTLNHIRELVAERKMRKAYVNEIDAIEAPSVFISSETKDYHQLIENAVQSLPPQQQKVFILRQQGLKNIEISERMNLSIESVKKYQHLAMKSVSEFVRMEVLVAIVLISFFL